MTAADRHREYAANFARLIDGVRDWDAPTPVAEWRARDVVGHLVEWLPGLLGGGGVHLLPGPSVTDDPARAFAAQTRQVQAILDDPERSATAFSNQHFGEMALGQVIDRFYLNDVHLHAWDLALASHQEPGMDEAVDAELLAGMSQSADLIRASGQFGEQQPVPDGASATQRLMAFLGRDPLWTPPGRG